MGALDAIVRRELVPLLLVFSTPHSLASAIAATASEWELEAEDLARLMAGWVAAGLLTAVADPRHALPTRLALFQAAQVQHQACREQPFPLRSPFELQRPMAYYPGLGTVEFHDPRRFGWVPLLEEAFPAIRQELLALLETARFGTVYPSYTLSGEWNAAYLWIFGTEIAEVTSRCKQTAEVLRRIPGVTAFGTSMLSALAPGTFLSPHYGYSNAKLRCQLPLVVPPGCRLKVGGHEVVPQEGQCIILDDSFLHSAWNPSDRDRYVLVFDFYHPDLSEVEIAYLCDLAAQENLAALHLEKAGRQGGAGI